MKRAKVMLSAIAVVAVVGGALAFKANKMTGFCLYQKTSSTTCPRVGTAIYDQWVSGAGSFTSDNATIVAAANCPAAADVANCTTTVTLKNEN